MNIFHLTRVIFGTEGNIKLTCLNTSPVKMNMELVGMAGILKVLKEQKVPVRNERNGIILLSCLLRGIHVADQ